MLSVPLYTMKGKRDGDIAVDPAWFGGHVKPKLIKQAIVAHLDRQRQGSARTKRRSDVAGSTRKLYRQKGTGNARAGMIRTPVRKGGGRTFGKRVPPALKDFPKKMKRLARDNAILAKIEAEQVMVISDLRCDAPKTKVIASLLNSLGADRGCVVATEQPDVNVYRSGRNIPRTDIRPVDELNAFDVLRRRHLIFTKPAFDRLTQKAKNGGGE